MNFSSIPAVNGSNSNSGAADETRNPRPETAGFLIGQGTDQKVWAKDLGNRRAIHFFISAKLKFKKEAISQSYIKDVIKAEDGPLINRDLYRKTP